MTVSVTSFGFKHGLPREADLVFDVRFLPNPYYVQELRPRNRPGRRGKGLRVFRRSGWGVPGKASGPGGLSPPKYVEEGRRHWWWRAAPRTPPLGAIAHALAAYIRQGLPGDGEPPGPGQDVGADRANLKGGPAMPDTIPNLHQWGARAPRSPPSAGDRAVHHAAGTEKIHQKPDGGGHCGRRRGRLRRAAPGHRHAAPPGISATAWSPWPTWSRSWSGCSPTLSGGLLAGQSFGNLILAALNGVTGSFEEAVAQMSQVLAITGRILPVTSADAAGGRLLRTGPGWWGSPRSVPLKRAGLPHRPCGSAPGAARRPPRPPSRPFGRRT